MKVDAATELYLTMGLLTLFGFVVTCSVLPSLKRIARRYGVIQAPGGRRLHSEPTPLLGGIGIYLPFAVVFAGFLALVLSGKIGFEKPTLFQMVSLFVGASWILVLGTLDDKFNIGWKKKLLGQLGGVLLLVLGGHSISVVTLPFVGVVDFGWVGIPVFVLAVIAVINAINLVDGLDGLAGGICFFAALVWGVIGLSKGDLFAATIGFTVSGSLLGFLLHNFPPASIFMGDGGSMMLGFILGTLATSSAAISPGQRLGASLMIIVPFLPFGIPLFEVVLSVTRRWLRGQAIFLGDGDHLHYRLTGKINDQRLTVAIFYVFSAALCGLTLYMVQDHESELGRLLVAAAVVALFVGALASIRLYRVETLLVTLRHRPHFVFLGKYLRFMKHRIRKAKALDELLGLLETGVRDLDFDSVSVEFDGATIERWTNPRQVHPENRRVQSECSFKEGRLVVKWQRPAHYDEAYNEYLRLTWHRFLEALAAELIKWADEPTCSMNGESVRLMEKIPS